MNSSLVKPEKKVTFTTQNFYNLLDNLYISDQLATFDEDLIDSKKIEYIFNFTKFTPFLSNKTKNYHFQFLNNTNDVQPVIIKIDNFVKDIFKLLSHKKNILYIVFFILICSIIIKISTRYISSWFYN